MLKKLSCILLLVLFSLGFSVNAQASDRFQWITSTDNMTLSYDTKSIMYNSTDGKIIDLWLKSDYTEEGAKKEIREQRMKGLWQEAKYDSFSHTLTHILISKKSTKFLEVYHYDVSGNVLFSFDMSPYSNWTSIVPASLMEAIRDKFNIFFAS